MSQRLKLNREFNRVYRAGKRYGSKNLSLILLPRRGKQRRIGFAVSRQVGTAVARNRCKRVLRALWGEYERTVGLVGSFDAILMGRRPFPKGAGEYKTLLKELDKLLTKAQLRPKGSDLLDLASVEPEHL